MTEFQAPYSDFDMTYDINTKRYVLTDEYLRSVGIDLNIVLDTEYAPEPSKVEGIVRERVSLLVYTNIYNHGRAKADKEYLLACNPDLRPVIRDAMVERIRYMIESGDLSTRSGALVSQGTRITVDDLIPSVIEEMILRPTGLLHRGEFFLVKDENLVY